MKYIVACLIALFTFCANAQEIKKEVLIFSKDRCPYCEQLKKDLDTTLIAAYPNAQFTVLNIKEEENVDRLRDLARQHKLKFVGLPLIFVGDTHILGWSDESAEKLKTLLQ